MELHPDDRPPYDREPARPWYTRPIAWLAVGLVATLIGLVVLPRIFPGFFLIFLPFVFLPFGRRRR